MEETISRLAPSEPGSRKSGDELEAIVVESIRTPRQRTTVYGTVSDERFAAARRPEAPAPTPPAPSPALGRSLPLRNRGASWRSVGRAGGARARAVDQARAAPGGRRARTKRHLTRVSR